MHPAADPALALDPADEPASDTGAPRPPGPLALALWAAGLRCLLVYVALPAFAPMLGAAAVVAIPVVVAAYALSGGTAAYAAHRARRERRPMACAVATTMLLLNVLGFLVIIAPGL